MMNYECAGCLFNLDEKDNILNIDNCFNIMLDNCCACKRAMKDDFKDNFKDRYKSRYTCDCCKQVFRSKDIIFIPPNVTVCKNCYPNLTIDIKTINLGDSQ